MFPRTAPMPAALAAALAALIVFPRFARGSEPAEDGRPPAAAADAKRADPAPAAANELPWSKKSRRDAPLSRPINSPREFLDKYGIGDSQWAGFFSGQPLSAAEEEVVVRILNVYPRFGQETVEAWAVPGISWDQVAAAGDEHRAKVFKLTGRAERVTKIDLPEEVAAHSDFPHFYQVRMIIDDAPYAAVVYCVDVPAAWKLDADLDEPATGWPLFLKVGEPDEPPALLFATRRLAWHPDRAEPEVNIDQAHVALAQLGVDIGRFQDVGQADGTGISVAEREPFYQILAALADERAAGVLKPSPEIDVGLLLQNPQAHQAHVLPVRGIARRVARVDVPDLDIRRRFHIDHYYEVDLSLPLSRVISLRADPKKKDEAVKYEHSFPATICVRELPAGLAVGDNLRQSVEAEALFFKIWHYHSAYAAEAHLPQPAPLFLARQVRLVQKESASNWVSDVLVGSAMLLALVMFVSIALWFRMSERSAHRSPEAAEDKPPQPDFSNLR